MAFRKNFKLLFLVIFGNVLEYYDFLLFAHIGYAIIPVFIINTSEQTSHLISLSLFALAFVIRPLGGFFFGRIADLYSTDKALNSTLKYASLASLCIAILPGYDKIGILASIFFIFFRSIQGFSLGGEYTTAGTFLMDRFNTYKCTISGTLGASGTMGSIFAFIFATLYIKYFNNTEIWRIAFVFGSIATYVSYYFRKKTIAPALSHISPSIVTTKKPISYKKALIITLTTGAITSVSCFIPMVYSNFYLTKIKWMGADLGMLATAISLITYLILTPIAGYISDKIGTYKFMRYALILSVPFSFLGFWLGTVSKGIEVLD